MAQRKQKKAYKLGGSRKQYEQFKPGDKFSIKDVKVKELKTMWGKTFQV